MIKFDVLELMRSRLEKRRNVVVINTGDPGSGKSYGSISMGECLDPDFDVDNIVFGFQEFVERFKEAKRGQVLVYEEAGVEFGSRKSQTKGNMHFSEILNVYRFKQVPTIFTLPNLMMIDKNGRRLMNFWVNTQRVDFVNNQVLAKFFIIRPDDWSDEVLRFKPRVIDVDTGERARIDIVRFNKPSNKLIVDYEKKKNEYFENLLDKIMRDVGKGMKLNKDAYPEGAYKKGVKMSKINPTSDDEAILAN